MVKFLIGVLTGIILTILVVVICLFALVRFREKPPAIADGSTLILRLEGEIPERPPIEFPIPLLEQHSKPTVQEVWALLHKAAADSRIKAVVLAPASLQIGWGKLQELRADLDQFRKSGKPLIAYLKSPGTREYYLATAANRIYIAPQDYLNLKGLRAELMFFKKTLDKIGVNVQIAHAGKYKDFGDLFTRTNMSPETREVLDSILDNLYGNLTGTIAQGRHKTPDEIKAIIDQGPFLSEQARASGLVDAVRFEDQMFGELKGLLKSGEIRKLSAQNYAKGAGEVGGPARHRFAFLVGEGAITRGDPDSDGMTPDGIESEGFDKLLRKVGDDSRIRGVIVRIDSPGGEVSASDEIWREMNLVSKKKPLVISMSDVAASGGYYMAMTGDPILAYPGTLTGSIGVVFGKPDLHGLYDKLGITKDMLTRGRYAAIDSDYRSLAPDELKKLQEAIDSSYKDFVTKVSEARRLKFDQAEALAQGRVWLGDQAKPRGLVDQLGGLDLAVETLKKKAGIPKEDKVTLVTYPPRRSIIDVLFSRSSESVIDAKLRPLLNGLPAKVLLKGGLLRLMPYAIEVK